MHYSLSNGKVFPDAAKQITKSSFNDLPDILEIKGIHLQTNSVNCGLVAISFATSLAKEDPANASYDSKKLQTYKLSWRKTDDCFSKSIQKRVSKCQSRLAAIELYFS